MSHTVSREALRIAQTPAPEPVYDAAGIYAGIVNPIPGRTWECAECLEDGVGGPKALLEHVAIHDVDAA